MLSSSVGLSDWRKARPYSRASRNAASSEMEPVRAWSQLLGKVSVSDLRLSSERFAQDRLSVFQGLLGLT
jgi:hypothetical protein